MSIYLKVAIAIPTYNREEVLLDTIRHVLNLSPPADEVIIIDQTQNHCSKVCTQLSDWAGIGKIILIRESVPNLPRARNVALKSTNADVIHFLDDDVIPVVDLVQVIRSAFEDPNLHALAGRVILNNETNTRKISPKSWNREYDYLYLPIDSETRLSSVATFCGCNHTVKRATALTIGGYDEAYIGNALREEADMALRLYRKGYLIVYEPRATIMHLVTQEGGCRHAIYSSFTREYGKILPYQYFLTKNYFPKIHYIVHTILGIKYVVLRPENRSNLCNLLKGILVWAYCLPRTYILAKRNMYGN